MSRKTILFSSFVIPIIGIAAYQFGYFTPYNCITAKRDLSKGQFRILVYGERSPSDSIATQLATKYGFEYDIVAGCTITMPEGRGFKSYNDVMRDAIKEKLGNNWEDKFNKEVDSLFLHLHPINISPQP